MERPCLLEIENFATSKGEAKRVVIELLSKHMVSPKGGWERATINFGPPPTSESFSKLVEDVRTLGICNFQRSIDLSDEFFGGTFGISTDSNFGSMTYEYAGYKETFKTPMALYQAEWELTDDILFYREESCAWSNEPDFKDCTRHYRGYLMSSIAVVDAFINRHVLMYKHRKFKPDSVDELQRTSRLEDRMDLFMKLSCGKDIKAINGGEEWKQFKEIRRLRNEITHINAPSLGYSIEALADHFNYVRRGIGGLLKLMRSCQGKPSLGFIDRLRFAPKVNFNHVRHKPDGNHIVNRKE